MARIKTDEKLGELVRERLIGLGLEEDNNDAKSWGSAHKAIEKGIHGFLWELNLLPNPSRDGTSERVADMYVEDLCWGLAYVNFPKCTTTPNDMSYDELVTVEAIETISLCEHHFQTIYGQTYVAYIPGTKVLGLSKFARVIDFFSHRPQIQERMTAQIYHALALILQTPDIAVVQKCQHFCMIARGVKKGGTRTTTSKIGGRFKTKPELRKEFFDVIR